MPPVIFIFSTSSPSSDRLCRDSSGQENAPVSVWIYMHTVSIPMIPTIFDGLLSLLIICS